MSFVSYINLKISSSIKMAATKSKSKSSSSSTEYPYPHLYEFVKANILPDELSKIGQAVSLYVDLILKEVQNGEMLDLNSIIYNISPFPGWIDSGSSNVWNEATSQLEDMDLTEDLR